MARATSVRLDEPVYDAVKHIARRQGVSLNTLIGRMLQHEIALEQEREMYEAATLLGEDSESDVGFAFAAQAEIVLRD